MKDNTRSRLYSGGRTLLVLSLFMWLITGVVGSWFAVLQQRGNAVGWAFTVGEALHTPDRFFVFVILPCLLSWIWFIRELRQYVDA